MILCLTTSSSSIPSGTCVGDSEWAFFFPFSSVSGGGIERGIRTTLQHTRGDFIISSLLFCMVTFSQASYLEFVAWMLLMNESQLQQLQGQQLLVLLSHQQDCHPYHLVVQLKSESRLHLLAIPVAPFQVTRITAQSD